MANIRNKVEQAPPPNVEGTKNNPAPPSGFLAKPWVALFLMFWAMVVQAMLTTGAPAVNGPALQRRFGFTLTQVGAIFSSIVVIVIIIYIPVTGLGRRRRPLFAAIGLFAIIVGNVLYILPEFVVPYSHSTSSTESAHLCSANISNACGNEPANGVWTAFSLQALGRAFMGFSSISMYSLAVAYLAEVGGLQASTYLGIYFCATALGPAVGIILSAEFLKIPSDFGTGREDIPSGSNPAWWLIHVVGASLAFVLMPLIALLPEKRIVVSYHATKQPASRSFVQGLKTIVTDPCKAVLLLAGAIDSVLPLVVITYSFKLMEIYFPDVNPAYLTYIMAGLVVPMGGAGNISGGLIIRRLSDKGIIKFCMIATVTTAALFTCLLIYCPDTQPTYSLDNNLTASCNSACGCSNDQVYRPVCGEDGISYFSTCHAGCNESVPTGYLNCACVGGNGTARPGECSGECPAWKLPVAAIFYVLLAASISLTKSPNAVVLMKLTEDEFTSATMAISEIGKLLFMLGTIPAAGALIDRSCLLWDTECGTTGSCLRYQRDTVARDFVLLGVGFKLLSCLSYLAALVLYKPPPVPPKKPSRWSVARAYFPLAARGIPYIPM